METDSPHKTSLIDRSDAALRDPDKLARESVALCYGSHLGIQCCSCSLTGEITLFPRQVQHTHTTQTPHSACVIKCGKFAVRGRVHSTCCHGTCLRYDCDHTISKGSWEISLRERVLWGKRKMDRNRKREGERTGREGKRSRRNQSGKPFVCSHENKLSLLVSAYDDF